MHIIFLLVVTWKQLFYGQFIKLQITQTYLICYYEDYTNYNILNILLLMMWLKTFFCLINSLHAIAKIRSLLLTTLTVKRQQQLTKTILNKKWYFFPYLNTVLTLSVFQKKCLSLQKTLVVSKYRTFVSATLTDSK